jgi:type IV pilus assembly protein PilA
MNIMQKAQKGFTLIELMIVVAIIGILAAVAIPQYGDYTEKTKLSKAAVVANSLKSQMAQFFAEQGECPADKAALTAWAGTGRAVSDDPVTGVVSAWAVTADTCAFTLTMDALGKNVLAGTTITMTPDMDTNPIKWTVTSADGGAGIATLLSSWGEAPAAAPAP